MTRTALRRELLAIALLLLAVFLAGSLLVHAVQVLRGASATSDAAAGTGAGEMVAATLVTLVGWVGAGFLPLAAAVHALRLFDRLGRESDRSWLVFLLGMAVVLPFGVGLALHTGREPSAAAGAIGGGLAFYAGTLGGVGAWVLFAFSFSALTAATLSWNPIRMIVGRHTAGARSSTDNGGGDAHLPPRARRETLLARALEPDPEEYAAIQDAEEEGTPLADQGERSRGGRKRMPRGGDAADARVAAEIESTQHMGSFGDADIPPVTLLTPAPAKNGDQGRRELDAAGQRLMDTLRTFRVEGDLVGRTTGPAVTQFEIAPAAGVKVRQIANLSNDLALAMRAQSVRVVAPIPGKGAVGIEIPNPVPETVYFRELLESPDFRTARAALPIALGKDLEGRPIVADLARMPHLLIAGATGSGKSVCVNTLVTSLLYRHTPATLRLLMVDPKMVELSVYNAIPHLRHKVVTDNRDAAAVLKWAVWEMQERYALLAENGARNLQDFNRKVAEGAALKTPKTPNVALEDRTYRGGILPYIVVIIDELADLMMTVQGEVETPLAMLAQKARAIGIHLILATQRPSVNVITGLIKANFPSRIAFRVASQVDSRTIIDGIGAESLLGNGDMLFIPPGKSEPARLQGAFISSDDTERLVGWFVERRAARRAGLADDSAASEADILEVVRRRQAEESGGGDDDGGTPGERDPLFRQAAEVVIQSQTGSTSLLQRKLKIGYGRAARIVDQLEEAGVLGEADGPRGRDVKMGLADLDDIAPLP